MRIKFLSIIASFFMVSFVITSCLDNDNNIEYSPDATIKAFALDTIGGYGVNYKFTIDQLRGEIYNEDSLPVHADTIIDRILITTLTTSSGVISMKTHDGKSDSIVNLSDSIDLRKYINPTAAKGEYLNLTVWAPDMSHKKEYKISIRKHRHDPDSLSWNYFGKTQDEIIGAQKTIHFKNNYFTYSKVGNAVKVYESNNLSNWSAGTATALSDLPNSIIPLENVILATVDNKVYSSTDGKTWIPSEMFTGTINTFVSKLPIQNDNKIVYLKTENEKYYLYSILESELGKASITETMIEMASSKFPVDNISYTTFKKGNSYSNIIVGKHNPAVTITINEKEIPLTMAWGYDGDTFAELGTMSSSAYCPEFKNPSIIYYNELLYIFGDDFASIYESQNEGVAWKKANKKFSFPYQKWGDAGFVPTKEKPEFRGRKNYSVIQDTQKDFIYVLFGKESNILFNEKIGPYNHDAEVWRGRLNALWFLQDPLK